MGLALRSIKLKSTTAADVEFLDVTTDEIVVAEYHFTVLEDEVVVHGAYPDVIGRSDTAADVRTVTRAVMAFVEAARLDPR